MRYAIGYTFINEETNFVSRPYLLTISKNNVFDLKIDKFSEIKNERLVVVPTVEFGKNLIQTLKKLQRKFLFIKNWFIKFSISNFKKNLLSF